MDNQFKDFYDVLRDNLNSYRGDYETFVDHGPDLFKLLISILNDPHTEKDARLKISAALAYYVAPFDIIPEQIYGPHGYVDDIFVCVYVLKCLSGDLGWDYLEEKWDGELDLLDVVEECYDRSEEILGDRVGDVLGYVGLD